MAVRIETPRRSVFERRKQDRFRRRRPYLIESTPGKAGADGDSSAGRWLVRDMDSHEILGELTKDMSSDRYRIVDGLQAGDMSSSAPTDYGNNWAAADAIWKMAYPVKWVAWLLMSRLVQATDWFVRLFKLAVFVFAAILAISSAPAVWDAKESAKRWLNDAIDQSLEQQPPATGAEGNIQS